MINKNRVKISDILSSDWLDKEAFVYGWIRTSRFSKNVCFIELNDGSSFKSLQLVIDMQSISIDESKMQTGTCISAKGLIVKSPGADQSCEMQVSEVKIVGLADETYPIQKKRHSLEFLREIPHLRCKTNTFFATFKVRSKLAKAVHDYFQDRNFLYIHSPIITLNDCEGGSEAFQITTLNLKEVKEKGLDYSADFFKRPAYLTVSGQLEAEPFALTHGAVYTFGPTFRADPSDTPRHAAEFWMIEPEMAFYDLDDLLELIEDFIKNITRKIKDNCQSELEFFKNFIEPELDNRYAVLLDHKFERIDFAEAIEILKQADRKFEVEPKWGEDLTMEHERYLVDEHFKKPVFITNYPENFKSFYMRINEDGKSVACVDLLVPGIGEIISGSQREERYDFLEKRMLAKGMEKSLYEWYLQTRLWGSAPHAGFGLGFERMIMYLTGMKNVKDVIPYPRAARKIY